ncbi:MAG: biotin/lipoyl-binding protein [Ruminococcus sp.]|nr:biotin/lipoyl-binding protein [Ruminococcus sp.]
MKKLIITLVCLAVIAGGGYFGYTKYKSSKDSKTVVAVVPVSLMAEPAYYYEYGSEINGNITSANAQKIKLTDGRLVKTIYVSEGDEVKKGDTILEYDMTVVELETEQKKNAVSVIEQSIKTSERELVRYQNLKPSENAPIAPDHPDEPDYPEEPEEPDYPEEPEQPDYPEEPEYPEEPLDLTDEVVASFTAEGTGSADDPYIINCTENAKITSAFFKRLLYTKRFAALCVYSEDQTFLYRWIIGPDTLTSDTVMKDASVSDGVTVDYDTGMITVDTAKGSFGRFSASPLSVSDTPADDTYSEPQDDYYDDFYPEDTYDDLPDEPEYTDNDTYIPDYTTSESEDYVYSRAEIAEMIKDKQAEIKQLKLDLKAAKLEYEQAKKKKAEGKVVAEMDGIVKKIGTIDDAAASGSTSDEDDLPDGEFGEYAEEFYDEDTSYDDYFAVIEGDGGASVEFMISELKLDQINIGDTVSVSSYDTGAFSSATITAIVSEPASYTAWNWGDNPNASTYTVKAALDRPEGFGEYDWLSITLDGSADTQQSTSLYLPIHYVRKEGSTYYIMRADKDGKLEKHYIKTGKIMYGSIEVTAGLSVKDKICFPYGKDVKEGVNTKDSEKILYPKNVDY